MVQIAPFHALRYHPGNISFISRVVAPPYDIIGPEEAEELRHRDHHNVIRLILGRGPGGERPEADYREAAAHLDSWRREGVLVSEPQAAAYVCEEQFQVDGVHYSRHGLICAMLLEEFESGHVLPHERTMAGPKADRLRLMEACKANLSLVFGVFSDAEAAADAAVRELADGMPLYEFRGPEEVAYRVWRVEGGEEIAPLAELLRREVLFIADGHHRYETALRYRQLHRSADGPPGAAPEDFIPVFCVSVKNKGLQVLPTHRLVRAAEPFEPGELLQRLEADFEVSLLQVQGPGHLAPLLRGIEPDSFSAYLGKGLLACVRAKSSEGPAGVPRDRSAAWRSLPVTQLHYAILQPLFDIPAEGEAAHPRLAFTQAVEPSFWDVESGRWDAAFFLPPTAPAAVEAVARAGDRMPPKSTYFYPKILSGLAFYPFEGGEALPRLPLA